MFDIRLSSCTRVVVVILASTFITAMTACTVSPPVLTPSEEGVYYVNPAESNHRLFYLPLTGTRRPELVWMGAQIRALTISPDGKNLAFLSFHEEKKDRILTRARIHVMDRESYTDRIIGEYDVDDQAVFAQNLIFHPYSNKIYFSRKIKGRYQVSTVDLKTGKIETVNPGRDNQVFPVLSPDGKKLLYYSSTGPGNYVCRIYDLKSENVRTLLKGESVVRFETQIKDQPYFDVLRPVFSADGGKIAFVIARTHEEGAKTLKTAEIVIYDRVNHQTSRITPKGEVYVSPVWLDNQTLVFTHWTTGGQNLELYDGKSLAKILPEKFRTGEDRMPVFSKKHHFLVYRSGSEGPGSISVMNLQIQDVFCTPVTIEALKKAAPRDPVQISCFHAVTAFEKAMALKNKKKYRRALKFFQKVLKEKNDTTYKKLARKEIKKIRSQRGITW